MQNIKKWNSILLLSFCLLYTAMHAQSDSTRTKLHFFKPAPSFNKTRTIILSSALTGGYTGTMLYLNQIWYAGEKKSKFHFFDDSKEWLQVDKMGHFHTTYMEAVWLTKMMQWTGTKEKKSALIGSLLGLGFQTSIEVFDGFSEKWGASATDVVANTLGASLAYTQYYFWGEQRIKSKYSFHEVTHLDAQLQNRSNELYGETKLEQIIKDYNGLVIWLSINPASFSKKATVAPWLNVAVGYAGGGMYGGFENSWEDENQNTITRYDVKRYRRFFLSADVDWDKIPTKSPYVKTLFSVLNIVKVPFPAMEFNTKGEIIFHPMFFLNWNTPIVLKK
jgi:uncharacterized protein YfiM (DUF2279 family)